MNTEFSTLLARATSAKKPDKTVIFNEIVQLLQSDKQEIAPGLAVKLLAYFLPPAPKQPKNAFQWVALACAQKDVRNYLRYVYCDGDRLIASDGHRMHVAPNNGRPIGFYDPKSGLAVDLDYTFPNIDRVIPTHYAYFADWDTGLKPDTLIANKPVLTLCESFAVQLSYIQDALALMGSASVYYSGNGSVMRFDFDQPGYVAVIMPMRK